MLCGVCGGLADYFGLDSKMVRIVAVVLLFLTGGSVAIGYLLAMILIPEENVSA